EQPGLERRPLERAAVQDVRADGRPDRHAYRPSPDVHLVSDRRPLPPAAAARDAAGAAVDPDRGGRVSAVRLRAPPPGRVDRVPARAAVPVLRALARIEPVRLPLPAVRAVLPVDDAGAAG